MLPTVEMMGPKLKQVLYDARKKILKRQIFSMNSHIIVRTEGKLLEMWRPLSEMILKYSKDGS